MDLNHPPSKTLVTGASGRGKSNFYTELILSQKARYKFIFDHEEELKYRIGLKAARTVEQLERLVEAGGLISFCPDKMFPRDSEKGFEWWCEFVYHLSCKLDGRKLFAVDELQKLIGPSFHEMTDGFKGIIETARKRGVDCIFACQGMNVINGRLRNQLTEVVTYGQLDRNSLKWLGDLSFDPEEVKTLGIGEYIWRSMEGHESTGNFFTEGGRKWKGN